MLDLEHLPHRPLSATQAQVLAAMEIDVYRRRVLPNDANTIESALASPAIAWAGQDSALARALAQAAGVPDVARWIAQWHALGESLPDLQQMRTVPPEKRSFWRRLRQRLAER